MKDLARKSNELEFISNHTYSCGDPSDRYLIDAAYDYRQMNSRFAKKPKGYDALLAAYKKDREKNALLKAIATYGSTIKDIAAGYQTLHDDLGTIQKDLDTLKGSSYLAEVNGMLGALGTILKAADGVASATEGAAIYDAARTMQAPLQATAKKLKDEHVLASLTEAEATAFSYWDSCATERLAFIRDYFPSYYKPKRGDLYNTNNQGEPPHLRFQGMAPTSVLDFAKEYRQYLLDREAFIARRPDYLGAYRCDSESQCGYREGGFTAGRARRSLQIDRSYKPDPGIIGINHDAKQANRRCKQQIVEKAPIAGGRRAEGFGERSEAPTWCRRGAR